MGLEIRFIQCSAISSIWKDPDSDNTGFNDIRCSAHSLGFFRQKYKNCKNIRDFDEVDGSNIIDKMFLRTLKKLRTKFN